MPNFKRIGGGPWKSPDDLTWNDPHVSDGMAGKVMQASFDFCRTFLNITIQELTMMAGWTDEIALFRKQEIVLDRKTNK